MKAVPDWVLPPEAKENYVELQLENDKNEVGTKNDGKNEGKTESYKAEIMEIAENEVPIVEIDFEEKIEESLIIPEKTGEGLEREIKSSLLNENNEVICDEVEDGPENKSVNFDMTETNLKIQESFDANPSVSQNYVEDFVNSSRSSDIKDAISENYSYEAEEFEGSLSPGKPDIQLSYSNKNSNSESNTIEEAIHEENKNEVELEFVDYGISIDQKEN